MTVVPRDLAGHLAQLDPGRCDACTGRGSHTLIVTCTMHGTETGRLLCDAHASAVRVVGGPWASNCGGTVCVDLRALDVAGDET